MAISHGQRLRRELVKLLENKDLKPAERLEAAKLLSDVLKSGVGERKRGKKKISGKSTESLLG